MRAAVKEDLAVAQAFHNFRNEVALGRHRGVLKRPFFAQPAPGNELQVVGARNIIVPAGVHAFDLTPIGRRERISKPAIRQRMLAPQAFGEIVERHDIGATARRQ